MAGYDPSSFLRIVDRDDVEVNNIQLSLTNAMVNKSYIIVHEKTVILQDQRGKFRALRWAHFARSGSQSKHGITSFYQLVNSAI